MLIVYGFGVTDEAAIGTNPPFKVPDSAAGTTVCEALQTLISVLA